MQDLSPDLHCLLLGLSPESADGERGDWLGRKVRLALQDREISASSPSKLVDPIRTTLSTDAEVSEASFVLAEVSIPDPVVFFYLGLARSLGKPIISLRRFDAAAAAAALPVHRQADFAIDYEDSTPGQVELAKRLTATLDSIERVTRLDHRVLLGIDDAALDWSRLSPVEHENLCFEIFLRQGFRDLSWLEGTREVDLTALLLDEDGRHQLYLVAIGAGLTDSFTVRGWVHDLDAIARRVNGLAKRHDLFDAESEFDVHLDFVWSPHECEESQVEVDPALLQELGTLLGDLGRSLGLGRRLTFKLGTWHRPRLEALIRRSPMLIRQYFTRDPTIEPLDRRKTAEDLYRDAARLGQRAVEASGELEQKYGLDPGFEWQRRAYTVTHSIGNAVFPVETYLDFIADRLEAAGDAEGERLAKLAISSVEKTKIHIFKFKNIARFKRPRLKPIDIVPRLEMSVQAAKSHGITVNRYIDEHHPPVQADPDLFDELLDELVRNTISWLEEATEKTLEITVKPARRDDLSPRLSNAPEDFLWLRYKDSGPGVPTELKEKIFELFFSTNPQGMGFGLAIVRKNLRDFGGDIVENGMPGHGVCFDIFLPISEEPSPR